MILPDVQNSPPKHVIDSVQQIADDYGYLTPVKFLHSKNGFSLFGCDNGNKLIKIYTNLDFFKSEKLFYESYLRYSDTIQSQIPCPQPICVGDFEFNHILFHKDGGIRATKLDLHTLDTCAFVVGFALGKLHKSFKYRKSFLDITKKFDETVKLLTDSAIALICQKAYNDLSSASKSATGICISVTDPDDIIFGPLVNNELQRPIRCKFMDFSSSHIGYQYIDLAALITSFDYYVNPEVLNAVLEGYAMAVGISSANLSVVKDTLPQASVFAFVKNLYRLQESLLNFSNIVYNKMVLKHSLEDVRVLAPNYYNDILEIYDSNMQTIS